MESSFFDEISFEREWQSTIKPDFKSFLDSYLPIKENTLPKSLFSREDMEDFARMEKIFMENFTAWKCFSLETNSFREQAFYRNITHQERARYKEQLQIEEESKFKMKIIPETQHHFSDYIMKRTPEAFRFYQKLRNLSLGSKKRKFKEILQKVIACIEKAAKEREKETKARPGYENRDLTSESKKIEDQIRNNSESFGDFIRAVLKVFTMKTFLCYYLNELLRSDDWEEINILTPFLGCLLYGFQSSEFLKQFQKLEGIPPGDFRKQELCLYRGTALTQERLSLYDNLEGEHFTWKGVTSTSRIKDVGQKYIQFSLMEAEELKEKKIGVLFVIKTDFASIQDYEGMVDLSQMSVFPKEEEVLLAPGIVFQLQKVCLMENGYKIKLRVKRVFDKAIQVSAMRIERQNKLISQELLLQICLELGRLLKENKLVQSLEIKDHMRRKIRKVETTLEEKTKERKLYGQLKPPCLGTIFRNLL